MKLNMLIGFSAIFITVLASAMTKGSNDDGIIVKLNGLKTVPATFTTGTGTLSTRLMPDDNLGYSLNFFNLSENATVAHIHFGQVSSNGGVMAVLCGGTKPACPLKSGRVNGTIHREDILAISEQGIHAGNFDEFLEVIRSGNAYVDVHSISFPSGEIRGQLKTRIED